MRTIEWIALGVTAVFIWVPFLYYMLTPPRKSTYSAPSPLTSHRERTKRRIHRALEREQIFATDHEGRERLGL